MSLKLFQHYLTTEDGRSFYVQNGVVSTRGLVTPLPEAPNGWQKVAFAWERNESRHGIQRSFSQDLNYLLKGGTITRDAFYKRNIDQRIFHIIQILSLELTNDYYKWKYNTIYKGELDMSQAKDNQGGSQISVPFMEGGVSKLLNASWSKVYDINFDDDAANLQLDGIDINYIRTYSISPDQQVIGTLNYYMGMTLLTYEGVVPGISFFDVSFQASSVYPNNNYFTNTSRSQQVRIHGPLSFYMDKSVTPIVRAEVNDGITGGSVQYVLFSAAHTAGENFTVDIDQTFTIPAGSRVHVKLLGGSGSDPTTQYTITGGELKIEFLYRGPETYVKAFTRTVLFRKLCKKILGHEEYAVSDLFDTDNRLITSMDAIRGITDAMVKISLADFFADADTDLMGGISIEKGVSTTNLPAGDRLRIEDRVRYYDPSDPIDLGEVKDMDPTFDQKKMAAEIKTGWKEPETLDVNGKYSFNASQSYTSPMKRTSAAYNLVSPWKSDPFEIESKRLNLDGKNTTDDRSDNDIAVIVGVKGDNSFFDVFSFAAVGNIMTKPSGFRLAPGQTITVNQTASNDGTYTVVNVSGNSVVLSGGALVNEASVSTLVQITAGGDIWYLKRDTYTNEADPDDFGVPSPTTIFNVDLSPHRKVLRHGRWLASMFDKYELEKLIFDTGTRNTALKTVQGATTIQENKDISISGLGAKMFLPYLFSITVNSPVNLYQLMEDGPNRCFRFTWNGNTYKGFNMKSAMAPNELNEQEYSLLCTADTDPKNLIF